MSNRISNRYVNRQRATSLRNKTTRGAVNSMDQRIRNIAHRLQISTVRTTGPVDPRPTSPVYRMTHTYTRKLLTADDGLFVVTSAVLNLSNPGSTFIRYRMLKFSVYGTAAPESFVTLSNSTSSAAFTDVDTFKYEDFGTQGSVRPAIHIQPNFDFRMKWRDFSQLTNAELFYITSLSNTEIVIQFTLEIESKPPSASP